MTAWTPERIALYHSTFTELEQRLLEIVECLVKGGGDELGIGEDLNRSMSMTAATECFWGTSGRGNPNAARKIRSAASFGFVRVQRVGRCEKVGHTEKGLELFHKAQAANLLPFSE